MKQQVRVYCADDHMIVIRGLLDVFEDFNQENNDRNIQVVGYCTTAQELLENVERRDVDVFVIDLGFESTKGDLSVIKAIKNKRQDAKIIVFSMRKNINTLGGCYRAGAMAYIVKGDSIDYLLKAIFEAANGKDYFMPDVLKKIALDSIRNPLSGLGERDARLFLLLAQNVDIEVVEAELGISEKTINNIVTTKIKPVLGVTRQEFRALAIEMGLIEDID